MEQVATLQTQITSGLKNRILLSKQDIIDSLKNWKLWSTLGWQDISLRYRRSTLGPFWITMSMALLIYTLGMVYSFLFKADITSYFPHLACGILIWNFLSTSTMELVDAFIESAHFIKQIKLPYTTYILKTLSRNLIIFFHNLLAVIPILIYYKAPARPLAALLGLFLFTVIGFFYGTALAMLGSRYRDIRQLIQSLLQMIFYLTPIMWMPDMLPERFQFVIKLNPLYQMIQLIRAPLLGQLPSPHSLYYCSAMAIGGFALMFFLLVKGRHRIAFWV